MSAVNKAIVRRFNQKVIENCDRHEFEVLVAQDFINHSAAAGQDGGREGLWPVSYTHLTLPTSDLV